ncbi:MAG: hypothetical protein AB1765_11130, partial [Candidatus Hydrogenedentota bacterium]
MKKTIIFALIFSILTACKPTIRITGRVIDSETDISVSEARILAMFWIEEKDKAIPKPDIEGLTQEEINKILDKDQKQRGAPLAYARTIADKYGEFELNKLYFSKETKTKLKTLKNPVLTRITLSIFARGYIKGLKSGFPAFEKDLKPNVLIAIRKPENWKELADDSSYETLRLPEYYDGYSKKFGATKKEKEWFWKYTHSNLWQAYEDSNVKDNKKYKEICGRDFSNIIVSTSGIQKNPEHERCGKLLRDMSVLREWE